MGGECVKYKRFNTYIVVSILVCFMMVFFHSSVFAQSHSRNPSQELTLASIRERNVLIVNGFQYGLPVTDIYTRSIVDRLVSLGIPVNNIFVEYLNLHRKDSEAHRFKMQDLFTAKSTNHSIDLIIAVDQAALDFIVNECSDLFEGVPLFITYNDEPVWVGPPRPLLIGAASNDAEGTVKYAFKLFPNTQNVVIVMGVNDLRAPFVNKLITALDNQNHNVNIMKTNAMSYFEMLEFIANLPPYTIAFYGSYFQDVNGDTFVPSAVAATVGRLANVPVFAFVDRHIYSGLLGGSVVINETFAKEIANVAFNYLSGALQLTEAPTIIPATFELLFDWQHLQRFAATTHVLPEETVFLNYTPSIWQLYRDLILFTIFFIVLLIALLVLLVILNRKQKATLVKLSESEMALRDNRDRLSHIITGTNVGTWEIDLLNHQLEINSRWADIVGYTLVELLPCTKETWYSLVEPNDLKTADALFQLVVQGECEFFDSQYRMRHKNGSWVWVLSRGKILKRSVDGTPLMMSGTHTDITQLKQLEEKIVESRKMYQSVVDTQQEMVTRFLPDTTLTFVNDAYCRAFGKTRMELLGEKYLNFLPIEFHDAEKASLRRLLPDQPFAVREYEVKLSDDTVRWHERTDIAIFNEFGEVVEIQGVGRDITRSKQAEENMLRAYDATIEGWARALDLKDEETEHHSQRVCDLTLRIAKKMGIHENELANIRRGALLHDIGKMGIPDSILHKPDKLSEDEWKIMQKHPIYAYEMLSPITYLNEALEIPYCHHEKWDGSGYPNRLKGEDIPLAARIFAVVDVYDALMSNRPYRKAWSQEKALDYIKEQAGIHFDLKVVDVFLQEVSVF